MLRWSVIVCAVFLLSSCEKQTDAPRVATNSAPVTARGETPVASRGQTQNVASNGFKLAVPPYEFAFPRDHGAHPEFATEWWYYTGHLQTKNNRKFGYQLTWFRTAFAPEVKRKSKWAARDVMFAHFALTDESGKEFYFSDRIGRANLGTNGADSDANSPRIWCGDWNLQFQGENGEIQTANALAISDAPDTRGQKFGLELRQKSLKAPIIHGKNGVSQKSQGKGRASHYYSLTRLQTTGVLTLGDEEFEVEGQSWFDHEFGSSQMAANQVGWDWFSLQFEDGRELMLYRLRLKDGGTEPFSSGTLIEKNGNSRHISLDEFSLQPSQNWKSPQTGGAYPQKWRIEVKSENLTLDVESTMENQEMVPSRSGADLAYWEGSVRARGNWKGQAVRAVGYLEMTGYARAFGTRF